MCEALGSISSTGKGKQGGRKARNLKSAKVKSVINLLHQKTIGPTVFY